MKVILMSNVENLGEAGDVITVKPGYARNKLIPMGLALRASKRNIAVAIEKKRVSMAKVERENQAMEILAKKLSKVEITIEVKVGEEEKMFGSITNKDLHKELETIGSRKDRDQRELAERADSLEELAMSRLEKIRMLEAQLRQHLYSLAKKDGAAAKGLREMLAATGDTSLQISNIFCLKGIVIFSPLQFIFLRELTTISKSLFLQGIAIYIKSRPKYLIAAFCIIGDRE